MLRVCNRIKKKSRFEEGWGVIRLIRGHKLALGQFRVRSLAELDLIVPVSARRRCCQVSLNRSIKMFYVDFTFSPIIVMGDACLSSWGSRRPQLFTIWGHRKEEKERNS